ncbi:DUF1444 family protein [Chitinophaga oryziterrae]|uniref:DUF1444 family protein n=1 Tax=Chitinophaga oryziterrae TaxID=1031224 RepID=A0A6N8JIZ6_9BACT|nr:DUF1444 family protein [Chitinophaga oryziterrae]MVT45205.1 DUF1444 family protein [Chitinophaga oryziterrae]
MSLLKNIFGKSVRVDENEAKSTDSFEFHKDEIYPWVKVLMDDNTSETAATELKLVGENTPVYRKLLGDLAIFYVVDNGDNFRILLKRDLPKHLTEEALHQIAINNLEKNIKYKLHKTNFEGYGLIADGNHEAEAICLPEIWDWLSGHFDNNLIVAVPAKDLIMMVPANDTDKISNLKIAVYETFKNNQRLLTKTLFHFYKESKEWKLWTV